MSATGFLQLLCWAWLVVGATGEGFGGDDFANNLFSDLAPVLALFGEKVTMQFMSQSMGWADNIILAMVPLGIMTAVVGAIRVGGPTWLKALIGRAWESRAIVESELMSSTSHEVSELWNGQQIVRIMGEGEIREFIILVGDDSDPTLSDEAGGVLGGEAPTRTPSVHAQAHQGHDAEDDDGYVAEDDEVYNVEDNQEAPAVADNEDSNGAEVHEDQDAETYEGHDAEANEDPYTEDSQGYNVEYDESFVSRHNEEIKAWGLDAAPTLEIMELRDDEKKKHIAEYSRFSPHRKARRRKHRMPTVFGDRKQARATDIEKSMPAGDPDEISKRPVAVVRNTAVHSPNMSLNVGSMATTRETYVVAAFGTLLQACLLVYAGLTATYFRDNTQLQKEPPDGYAFPCMVVGTVMLVLGTAICGHVVESSTSERRYRATGGKEARVVWLQRSGTFNDQAFKSFAIFPTKAQRAIVTSQRSRLERNSASEEPSVGTAVEVTTTVATVLTLCGFVVQFVGLRGMDWTVAIAQLAATLLMAALRSLVRRNLAERPNSEPVPPEHELDWLAMTLAYHSNAPWLHPDKREWDGEGRATHTRPWKDQGRWDYRIIPVQEPKNTAAGGPTSVGKSRAHQAMLIRRDLGALAGWRGPASAEAVGLASAIEIALETLLGRSGQCGDTLIWHLTSSSCGVHEPVVFRATREENSWKTCADDIEAALSLWLYSVYHQEKSKEGEAAHGPRRRLAGTTQSQNKFAQEKESLILLGSFDARILRRDLSLWLPDNSIENIIDVDKCTDEGLGNPIKTHRIVGFAQNTSGHPPTETDEWIYWARQLMYGIAKEATLAVQLPMDLKKLYVHHIFSAFMWAASEKAAERHCALLGALVFGTEVEIRSFLDPETQYRYNHATDQLSNKTLSALAQQLETTGVLGSVDEVYYGILPPLSAWNLLPPVHVILKRGLEAVHHFEQQGDWRRVSLTCVGLLKKTALFHRDNRTDVASEATALVMELLRVLTETTNFRKGQLVNDDTKIHQLVDSITWASAQVAADNDLSIFPRLMGLYKCQGRLWKCDLVGDISDYPTILPGEFGFETFHKAACDDVVPEKLRHGWMVKQAVDRQDFLGWTPMHYAVARGSQGVLGYVMRWGADVNIHDVRRRTPLHYAYCHDDAEVVKKLLRAGADVNAMDAGGMTPLHDAAKHGAAKVAAALIEGGADIGLADYGGRTPLAWAVWSGHADLARNHLWDPSSKIQSDSYGRTPLHMAVTSDESLGKDFGEVFGFLVPTIDMDAEDMRGYTPLHVAAIKGHLSAVQWLSSNGANVHAKEGGWYYVGRGWRRNLVKPGLTPLYLAKLMLKRAKKKQEVEDETNEQVFDQSDYVRWGGGWESDYSASYEGDSDIDEYGNMVKGYKRRYELQPGPDAIKGLEAVIQVLLKFEPGQGEDMDDDQDSTEDQSDIWGSDEERVDEAEGVEEGNGEEGDNEDGDAVGVDDKDGDDGHTMSMSAMGFCHIPLYHQVACQVSFGAGISRRQRRENIQPSVPHSPWHSVIPVPRLHAGCIIESQSYPDSLPRAERHGSYCGAPISSEIRHDVPPGRAGDIALLSPRMQPEEIPVERRPSNRDEGDEDRLAQFGYKQELKRDWGLAHNFGVSFSIISVITGISTLFSYGLNTGGPAVMSIGWIVVSFFTLLVAIAMAEVVSAIPTSGGPYFWSAMLAPPRWSPFAAWLTGWYNLLGQVAVTTGITFGLANLIPTAITLKNPSFTPTPSITIGIYAALLLSHAVVNTFGVRILRHLNNVSIALHSAGITALCIAVLAKAPTHQPASFVFGRFHDGTGAEGAEGWSGRASAVYVAVCGALLSQYTLTGFDASAHLSEETRRASWSAPIGVVSSVGFSALFGFFVLMALLFSVQDFERTLDSVYGQPVLQILVDVAGENGALGLFCLIMVVAVGVLTIFAVGSWVLWAHRWFTGPSAEVAEAMRQGIDITEPGAFEEGEKRESNEPGGKSSD
ncbi:hypothetical protein CHGG_00273 [Chaetomium globosum CBS 148.51]|uniref:Uncharacterized protein n=1 Tax=Chaetomium globosum (strain ATCC 6205 / CBS 148.51 / DSM 1962 / NBRC 6347 / NRRL 1970) TaxID=306901 RepID=Q2HHN1_CHAGB|nr:uncharacterized protein CHGG_00273 [Chaetomium globosum CBS 148.51]EAQ92038.1 hypothetical protein CHGG_00273 [Chaetomium globosum CBS 148.51]